MTSYGGEAGRRIPEEDCNFHRDLVEVPWRTTMKPLNIVQVCVCAFEGGVRGLCGVRGAGLGE